MAGSGRTFRAFVRSTFNNLKVEQNALQKKLLLRLRELCEARGYETYPPARTVRADCCVASAGSPTPRCRLPTGGREPARLPPPSRL